MSRACEVCSKKAVDHRADDWPLCHDHLGRWLVSQERRRALDYGPNTMLRNFSDFVRAVQAEIRNGRSA